MCLCPLCCPGFIVMIMTYLYVASAASKFTQLRLSNPVSSLKDLQGHGVKVQTWTEYMDVMAQFNITDATGEPW